LPEGTHRIVVDGGGAVEPVSDVFETVAGIED
jgi:hypothetical protein